VVPAPYKSISYINPAACGIFYFGPSFVRPLFSCQFLLLINKGVIAKVPDFYLVCFGKNVILWALFDNSVQVRLIGDVYVFVV